MTSRAPSVADEIRQTQPFPSPATEAVVTLLRTADVLRRSLSRVVEPHGITLQQYNVLRILQGAGPDGIPTLDVASRMVEAAPGITRLLDRLEKKKLVRRRRCPEDHRRVLCFATEGARRLLATVDEPILAAGRAFFAPLGTDRTDDFIALLNTARQTAGESVAVSESSCSTNQTKKEDLRRTT